MAKRRTYMKLPCEACGQSVARNNINQHRRACPNKPLDAMTVGELFAKGITTNEAMEDYRRQQQERAARVKEYRR